MDDDVRGVWRRLVCVVLALVLGIAGTIVVTGVLPMSHRINDLELGVIAAGMFAFSIGAYAVLGWLTRAGARFVRTRLTTSKLPAARLVQR